MIDYLLFTEDVRGLDYLKFFSKIVWYPINLGGINSK